MNKTDQNIQKVLSNNQGDHFIDPEMEQNIMDIIKKQKDYSAILLKTKRKAKIGLMVSLVLFIIYISVTYAQLIPWNNHNAMSFKVFYPSIFTAIVVVLVYFKMIYGIYVFKGLSK